MRETKIIVTAGRVFSHPFESYSNLRPMVTVEAQLGDGDKFEECVKTLQAKAEMLVEDHKQHMLKSLEELHEMGIRQAEVARLDRQIKDCQERLDRLREQGTLALDSPEDEIEVEREEQDRNEDYRRPLGGFRDPR